MFDDCLDLESTFFEEGRAQGVVDAQSRGAERGRADAAADGRRIGMEVGFYAGCAQSLIAHAAVDKRSVCACVPSPPALLVLCPLSLTHTHKHTHTAPPLSCVSLLHRTLDLARALDTYAGAMTFDVSDELLDEQLERLRARFRVLQKRGRTLLPLPDVVKARLSAAIARQSSEAGVAEGEDPAAAAALPSPVSRAAADAGRGVELQLEGGDSVAAAAQQRRPRLPPPADKLAGVRNAELLF